MSQCKYSQSHIKVRSIWLFFQVKSFKILSAVWCILFTSNYMLTVEILENTEKLGENKGHHTHTTQRHCYSYT